MRIIPEVFFIIFIARSLFTEYVQYTHAIYTGISHVHNEVLFLLCADVGIFLISYTPRTMGLGSTLRLLSLGLGVSSSKN